MRSAAWKKEEGYNISPSTWVRVVIEEGIFTVTAAFEFGLAVMVLDDWVGGQRENSIPESHHIPLLC